MQKIMLIQGPNLNLLGVREPSLYGKKTLYYLHQRLEKQARMHNATLLPFQSNAEHELINQIHTAPKEGVEFMLMNAAGLTHTSVALRDALLAVQIPFIEIHISNVHKRETFRHQSLLSDIAIGTISGLGTYGYELALQAALKHIKTKTKVKEAI